MITPPKVQGELLIGLLIVLTAAAIGTLSWIVTHPNNAVEEAAERVIERKLERLTGAEEGSLENKLDLTPWAPNRETEPEPTASEKSFPASFDEPSPETEPQPEPEHKP